MSAVTRTEWTIRDRDGQAGEMYGWWPEETARQLLARRRSHHAADGPFTLICRTWIASDEVIG